MRIWNFIFWIGDASLRSGMTQKVPNHLITNVDGLTPLAKAH